MSSDKETAPQIDDRPCQDCGEVNPVWFADNDVWNSTVPERVGYICPNCFIRRADSKIRTTGWKLVPEVAAECTAPERGKMSAEGKMSEAAQFSPTITVSHGAPAGVGPGPAVTVECTAPAPQPAEEWIKKVAAEICVGKDRCPICAWPLANSVQRGCIIGNCAFRPEHCEADVNAIKRRRAEWEKVCQIIRAATPQVTPTRTYSEIDLLRMRRYAEELRPYLNKEYPDPPRGLLGSIVGMLERSIEGTSEQASPTPDKSRDTGVSLDGGKTIHSKFKND